MNVDPGGEILDTWTVEAVAGVVVLTIVPEPAITVDGVTERHPIELRFLAVDAAAIGVALVRHAAAADP